MTSTKKTYRRRYCGWCGRGPNRCAEHGCVSDQTKIDLLRWINRGGHRWRQELRDHWTKGGDELRSLRNAVGPSGLTHINPTELQRREFDHVSR